MRIRFGKGFWSSRWGLIILSSALGVMLIGVGVFTYYYVVYARMIDERLSGNFFQHTTGLFTQPGRIFTGESVTAANLEDYLQHSGYTEEYGHLRRGPFRDAREFARNLSRKSFFFSRRKRAARGFCGARDSRHPVDCHGRNDG